VLWKDNKRIISRGAVDADAWRPVHWALFAMIASSFLLDGILFSLVPATLYLVEPLSGHATAILAADSISFMAGALVLGRLGDRMGRRSTLVTSLLIYTAGAAAFTAAFQLGRLDLAAAIATTSLVNFGVGGETGPAYAALAEYAPARRRGWVLMLAPNFWNVGAALIAALSLRYAELTGDPRATTTYTFATAVVLALLLLIVRYRVPESPRWLLARGRAREAEEVSRRYGVRIPAGNPAGAGGGLGRYAWRLLLLTASFTIQLLVYNVASYYLPYAPGFAYGYAAAINVAVSNAGASAGALLLLPLIDRSRRSSFLLAMAGGLATALGLMAAHGGPLAIYMAALFANTVFVEWAWAVVSALESELFPTAHRSTAVGLVTALSWLVNTAAIIWGGEAGARSLLWLLAALWGSGVAIAALWRARGVESSGRELEELSRGGPLHGLLGRFRRGRPRRPVSRVREAWSGPTRWRASAAPPRSRSRSRPGRGAAVAWPGSQARSPTIPTVSCPSAAAARPASRVAPDEAGAQRPDPRDAGLLRARAPIHRHVR